MKKVKKKRVKKSKTGKRVSAKKKIGAKKCASRSVKKTAQRQKTRLVKTEGIPAGSSLEEVGVVTHYFPKVNAAVVKLTKGSLSIGDNIYIKGHTSNFTEKVESMQLDHIPIQTGEKDQEIGLKVKSKVREHDIVYKILPS